MNLLTAILLITQSVSFLFFPFDILPNMLYNHYISAIVFFIDGVPRPLGLALLGFELLTFVLFLGSAIAIFLKRKIFIRSAIFLNLLNVIFCLWILIHDFGIWVILKILFSGFMIFLLIYYFKEHFGLNRLFKRRKAITGQNEETPPHS